MRDERDDATEYTEGTPPRGRGTDRGGTPAPTLAEIPRAEFRKLLKGLDPRDRRALLAARPAGAAVNRATAAAKEEIANTQRA